MYDGSCLCAGVKYRIAGDIPSAAHCHCTMCQKQHGAAFASYANVRLADFSWLQGSALLAAFESSPGVRRMFCSRCGSSLAWHSEHAFSHYISVALGTLDTAYAGPVGKHIHTDTRARWLPD